MLTDLPILSLNARMDDLFILEKINLKSNRLFQKSLPLFYALKENFIVQNTTGNFKESSRFYQSYMLDERYGGGRGGGCFYYFYMTAVFVY